MKELAVNIADYRLRFQQIQEFLKKEDIGAVFVYSPPMEHKWAQTGHVSYLSGWANHDRIVDSAVVIPAKGDVVLLLPGMPYMVEQIMEVSPIEDIRLIQAVDPNAVSGSFEKGSVRSFAGQTQAILKENGLEAKDVSVVGIDNMPVPLYQHLIEELGEKVKIDSDIVADLRYTKSPDEIELMRHAAHLSDLGFETMLKTAKAGMRGIEIIAEMERVVRREGADHAKYWMASGPGPDWENVHLDIKPHLRVLEDGDLMSACSYVCYKGYWCHGQRIGTLGKRCSKLDEIARITREAQDAGLAKMKPGVPIGHVFKAIKEKAAKSDWTIQGGRIGHGMGLDYSERPHLTEYNERLLEIGSSAVIHTMYSLPGSGKMFISVGDVCCVSDNGAELLMKFPREPFVAGQ